MGNTETINLLEKCKKNIFRTKKRNLRKCFTLCNNLDYAKELKRFCKKEDGSAASNEETVLDTSNSDLEDVTPDNTNNSDLKHTESDVKKIGPEESDDQPEESEKNKNKENIINIINDVISIVMETNDDVQSSKVSPTEATTKSTPTTTVEVKTTEPPAETTPSA